MKSTIETTETNFEAEVLKSPIPVIVDFWAPWCGPCKMLAPTLEEIATEQAGKVKVAKVNVDENGELASRYGVTAMPTLLYFSNGQVHAQTIGAAGKKAILAKLADVPTVA